jgi:thiol-disulfide isomerase/thioredoxin
MKKTTSYILQLSLCLLFLISAITKLLALDSFELFVYNVVDINYDTTSIISRLIIGIEFCIAAFVLYGKYARPTVWIGIGITAAFSAFLLLHLQLDNCYCFGPNFPFTAKESLIKNVIIIGLFLAYYLINKKQQQLITIPVTATYALLIGLISFPFLYNPANCIIRLTNQQANNLAFYKIKEAEHSLKIDSALAYYNINKNKNQIVGILSSQCKHCKQANEMLLGFNKKYNFGVNTTLLIIGDKDTTKQFIASTSKNLFSHQALFVNHFMDISKGVLPMFLFIKNKEYMLMNAQSLNDEIFTDFSN